MHTIRTMTQDDYDAVIGLMEQTPGISIRDADSREATARCLEHNPGLSFVSHENDQLVGYIMSGHDGRRGYLQHLVVHPAHRRIGIAHTLVESCLGALEELGIRKCHIDVSSRRTPRRRHTGRTVGGSCAPTSSATRSFARAAKMHDTSASINDHGTAV